MGLRISISTPIWNVQSSATAAMSCCKHHFRFGRVYKSMVLFRNMWCHQLLLYTSQTIVNRWKTFYMQL